MSSGIPRTLARGKPPSTRWQPQCLPGRPDPTAGQGRGI